MKENTCAERERMLATILCRELYPEDHAELLSHLDSCGNCQRRLEELAASGEEWAAASEAIRDREVPTLSHVRLSVAATTPEPTRWNDSLARKLLSPPVHPEMLGRLGRYDVERLIGSGGMGLVFKGYDQELNRPVAIKLLAPHLADSGSARQRFSREARAAAAVVHSHVVPIHGVETDCELPYLVMQYVAGESLQERIDRQGPLELDQILRIGVQVADGLAAAHQHGLVHRDIKPSNILLESGVERALITDFGLARAADDASLTRSGMHPGTPHYMSPEQALGGMVDGRSDLFSLGSMFYTMSTGRPPFCSSSSLGVLRMITDAEPIPLTNTNSRLPDWWIVVVERLMSKAPEHRFESAGQVKELLEECLRHLEHPSTVSIPRALRRSHVTARKTSVFYWGGLVMVSVLILSFLLFQDAIQKPGERESVAATADPFHWMTVALDRGRGDWVGKLLVERDGKKIESNASVKLEGDEAVSWIIIEGDSPDFRASLAWPRERPTEGAIIELRTGYLKEEFKKVKRNPPDNQIRSVTVRYFHSDGQSSNKEIVRQFSAAFDLKTRTLNCVPVKPANVSGENHSEETASDSFRIEISETGALKLYDLPLKENVKLAGELTVRVGKWIDKSIEVFEAGSHYSIGRNNLHGTILYRQDSGDISDFEEFGMYHITLVGQEGLTAYGLIEAPQNWLLDESGNPRTPGEKSQFVPGYFVLDKESGEITRGLSGKEFQAKLRQRGIAEPELHNVGLLWEPEFLPLKSIFPWYRGFEASEEAGTEDE